MKIVSAFAAYLAFLCVIFNLLAPPAIADDQPIKGYPLNTVLWPVAPIPTCWDMQIQAFNQYAPQREIVGQAVANTWEAAPLICFVGWDRCIGQKNQGLTIVVNQDGPATFGLGTQLINLSPGIQLNFEFTQWSPSSQLTKDECIRKIAVHEFGLHLVLRVSRIALIHRPRPPLAMSAMRTIPPIASTAMLRLEPGI
jgi:hypothetical protein